MDNSVLKDIIFNVMIGMTQLVNVNRTILIAYAVFNLMNVQMNSLFQLVLVFLREISI